MIRVDRLAFSYPSSPPALRDVSFDIADGEVFGFLGPSGSGKSTTQKILIRLLKGYTGTIEVMGRALGDWDNSYFNHVGVCFELPSHYRKLTALENLAFFARLYGGQTRAPDAVLAAVGLEDAAHKRVEQFSKGMHIRLNLARALLPNPKLLFLDEPTAGLDPGLTQRVTELIRAEQAKGTTVFLTTHDMAVADGLCDRVGFLMKGQLRKIGVPRDLRLEHARRVVRVRARVEDQTVERDFPLDGLADNPDFQALSRTGRIETMHSQEMTLADVFIAVTGEALIREEQA